MLRADEHPADMRPDYTFDFDPANYTQADHAMWHSLCERQVPLLKGRACNEYIDAIAQLQLLTQGGIPDYRRVSDMLDKATGWRLVPVPGLIPGPIFQEHLSKRQFPITWWIREPAKMDYLQEPDIFHDFFGHVPLLAHPVFADYMQQFGLGGVKAEGLDSFIYLARLYWFTVEFGLISTDDGLRIYGSGIVSSAKESIYALESPVPMRLGFDLKRVMRTDYRIDDVQKTYFVIDSFDQLFDATKPDFTPYYDELKTLPMIGETEILESDHVYS
ncbi:MAG: phenylalanine 4-monooxygenase [Rickettsiales bacterium]|nr:phenylalanine 4-monooxygenase [Rickettsiales bacterium]